MIKSVLRSVGVALISTRSSKKGQTFLDILIIAVMLFVMALAFILVASMQKGLYTELMGDEEFSEDTAAGESLKHFDDHFVNTLDNMFLIVFVLAWVAIIVSSLFVDANPVFLIVTVIFVIIMLVVVGVLSNSYQEFIVDGDLYTFSAGFPKTSFVMEHLLLFCLFMAVSGALALYGKNTLGGGV